MHAERDHLVTVVFPELRERVEQLGLEFFDVDLRWGVPAKDANGETANSWEYCRQWIDRVEPFFVCILGQRYGWVPEPEQLKAMEDSQRQQEERRSITDMEVRHAVLNSKLKRRSYFYLRATEAPAAASEYVDPPPLLSKLEQLKNEVRSCGRLVRDYPCEWTGSGFAGMEEFGRRVLDDLWSGVLRDERYVSKEVWRQVLGTDPGPDPRYTDESQPVPEYLAAKIVALARPKPKDPLDAQREQMDAFAASRLRWFQGRTRELQQLTGFLHATAADAPRLAVVVAVPGQGKSALLAHLHEQLKTSPHFVITHFVGATERSAGAHALVERLLGELDHSGIPWPVEVQPERQEPKQDFNTLCLRLAQRLRIYAGAPRIVVLLDALNQLSDGHGLPWLPTRLGPSVRVIVSCIENNASKADSPEQRVLNALASRRPAPLRVPLGPMAEDDVRNIVVAYLREYCHELDREHLDTLCAITQARNPLYLLVMLNELRTLGGNDLNLIVPARIASMPHDHPDTVSLFRWVLKRLEVFGPEAVRWWCLYLALGRVGMASHELADMLARKLGADATAMALRIERSLRRYLQHRGPQLDFFHGQLRQAVLEQYGLQADATNVHSDIASFFCELADPERNQSWKGDSPRPFLEVAFHLAGAQQLDELCETLCDLMFIAARCRHGQVFSLQSDYQLAMRALPEAQEDLEKERKCQARAQKWAKEITEYAGKWSDRRDRVRRGENVTEPEPALPTIIPSVKPWSKKRIMDECKRIIENPTRIDRLRVFAGFVENECYPLLKFGSRPGFALQHAFNSAPAGPVHATAARLLPSIHARLLLRQWSGSAGYNPHSALLRTLEGHSGLVYGVSITPDGRRAVSGSSDKTLRLWDLESGQCLLQLEDPRDTIKSLIVTPDGRRAVSGSGYNGVVVKPDGQVVMGGGSNVLHVWDLENGLCLRTLKGHGGDVINSVSVTPDGRQAVSGSDDKTLRIWDLENGMCLRTLEGHTDSVSCVTMTPDGRKVVSGSRDTTLRFWDLETGTCLRTLEGHNGVESVSVTPDGRRAVSVQDKTLCVWDLETGRCTQMHEGVDDMIHSENVTLDGRRAVSIRDKTLYVWDLETGRYTQMHEDVNDMIHSENVTPDGRWVVSGSEDNAICVWDLESGACLRTLEGHSGPVDNVIVTLGGRRVVSGSQDKTLRLWSLETGACLRVIEGQSAEIAKLSVTSDGRRALTVGKDGTICTWDLESGECLRTVRCNIRDFMISMTPDQRRAVSGSFDKTLRVWDLESGKCLLQFEDNRDIIKSVCVTPDGRRAVSGSGGTDSVTISDGQFVRGEGTSVRVWDLETGMCLRTLEGHSGAVYSVRVTPDGRRAVSGSDDKTLRIWDLQTGECLLVLAAPAAVNGAYVLQDRIVISCLTGVHLIASLRGMTLGPDVLSDCGDEDYEQVLRSGLGISRREKGSEHEETLAHLSALIANLNRQGRTAEAVSLARERVLERRVVAEKERETTSRKEAEALKHREASQFAVFIADTLDLPQREITLAERRESATRCFQKGLWEAATGELQKLLDAGEPLAEHAPKLVTCLLNAHEALLESDVSRIQTLLQRLDQEGHADLSTPLRKQLQAKLPGPRKKWWRFG